MHYIMADCYKNGGRHMTLEVRESNIPAQNLYNKLGFSSVGKRPCYYTAPAEDAVIMWRDL
jgi:ribosomal-protein-alanine N-acetyltransferase